MKYFSILCIRKFNDMEEEKSLREITGWLAESVLPPMASRKIIRYKIAAAAAFLLSALPFTPFI